MGKLRRWVCVLMILLLSVGAVSVPAAADPEGSPRQVSAETWEILREDAKNRQRRIIYDNDGDDACAFPTALEPSVDNLLALRTTYLKDYPVDTIFYTPRMASFGYLTTRTQVGDRFLADYPARPGADYYNLTPWLHERETDPLQAQVDFARSHDKEIFVGVRVNDSTHDQYERPGAPFLLYSPFKRAHPELIMSTDVNAPLYGTWSAFDFGQAEFRAYFAAVVKELIRDYDIDGVAFDFFRDYTLFRSVVMGGAASGRERQLLTDLFAEIRDYAEVIGKQRGKPILISVKLPDSVGYLRQIGIDLREWLRRDLVDLVIGGGYTHMETWSDFADLCHRYGAKYYASVEPDLGPSSSQIPAVFNRNNPAAAFGTASAALRGGADGVQYFNLFSLTSVQTMMRPDLDALAAENKRSFVSDRYGGFQEGWLRGGGRFSKKMPRLSVETPSLLLPGGKNRFVLEYGDDPRAWQASDQPALIAALYARVEDPRLLRVSINKVRLTYLESTGQTHYFRVPVRALRPGANPVKITLPEDPDDEMMMETIVDGSKLFHGPDQLPWRRFYPGIPGVASERLVDGKYVIVDAGEGRPGLHYALALPPSGSFARHFPFRVQFECQVIEATDDRSVVLRVADGSHIEAVSLQPAEIKLLSSGQSVAFDTTQAHRYELIMDDGQMTLLADDRIILSAEGQWAVLDNSARLAGAFPPVPGMEEYGLLFGSLSLSGRSEAHWDNIRISRPRQSAWLNDFVVQTIRPRQIPERAVAMPWNYQANSGDTSLSAGKNAYMNDPMAAEVDLSVTSGSAEILVSNGGWLTRQVVSQQITQFAAAGRNSGDCLPWTISDEPQTRRIDYEAEQFTHRVQGQSGVYQTGATNVSGWLSGNDALLLTPAQRQLIRDGGVLVRPLDGGQVEVHAIRINIGVSTFSQEPTPLAVPWAMTNSQQPMLAAGNYAWLNDPMAAEASLGICPKGTEIFFSNGGWLYRLNVNLLKLQSPQADEVGVIRFEYRNEAARFFRNGTMISASPERINVSGWLISPEAGMLNDAQRQIMRYGGIVVYTPGSGTADVRELRTVIGSGIFG